MLINVDTNFLINFSADNGRIVYDFRNNGKIPSIFPLGMTIDTKGYLYVAMYYEGAVLKIDPR